MSELAKNRNYKVKEKSTGKIYEGMIIDVWGYSDDIYGDITFILETDSGNQLEITHRDLFRGDLEVLDD